MIKKASIKEFLEQELDDWSGIKKLTKQELLAEIKAIYPKYKPKKYELYKHQLAMLLLGMITEQFLFFAQMGSGKTLVSIELMKYFKWKQKVNKVLVVCLNVTSIDSWCDEFKLHSDLKVTPLLGTTEERRKLLDKKSDAYIINYAGLQRLLSKKEERKGKNKFVADDKYIKQFAKMFDMVIFDESHQFKNKKSLTQTLCNKLTNYIPYRFGLTGTPMGRNPLDLWTQFYVMDKGETLGRNITLYRESFFKEQVNYFGGVTYVLNKKLEGELSRRLNNRSLTVPEEEANELPPMVVIDKALRFPKDNLAQYQNVRRQLAELQKNSLEKENMFHKMRQICSGYMNIEDRYINFEENPKLEMLEDLIESIGTDEKVIISTEYTHSGDIIADLLDKMKIKYVRLYGKTKDKIGVKNEYLKNDKIKIFLINSRSGGQSLNLQIGHYMILYETPVSPIYYEQLIKRVHRTGQTKKTFIYRFVTKDTVESDICDYLQEGKDLYNSLIKGEYKI